MADDSQSNAAQAANTLASKIARVQLTEESFLGEVFGSRMFRIQPGWEIEQLKRERSVTEVASLMQLRAAMEDTAVQSILIPSQNALTMEAVKRELQQSGQDKTLFWEA